MYVMLLQIYMKSTLHQSRKFCFNLQIIGSEDAE